MPIVEVVEANSDISRLAMCHFRISLCCREESPWDTLTVREKCRNMLTLCSTRKLTQRNELLSWFFDVLKELSTPLRSELLNFRDRVSI